MNGLWEPEARRIRKDFLVQSRPILSAEHRANFSIERRHFVLHDIPHDLRIETELFLNQNIAQTCNLLPFHGGMPRAKILREFFDGLADDFKIADDGIDCFLILKKCGLGKAAGVCRDFSCGLENILEIDPRIPRHRRLLVE